MSAVEEIQEAINELTELKAKSTPGWWWGHLNILGVTRVKTDDNYIVAEVYGDEDEAHCNAELITTLHRTIDAQLAILRVALAAYTHYSTDEYRALDHDKAAVQLSRAINGGTQ